MRSHPQSPGKVTYGDSYSIGQVAQMSERPFYFVRWLIDDGLLAADDRGLVTNRELRRFYTESGDLLNERAEA